jgi:PAS domain S-box-containing protein
MSEPPPEITMRHLARVVESSDDAIVSKDLNGTIMSWNRAAERMFGYTAKEAIGQSIRMIIPADRQAEEDTVLAKLRAGETIDHYETVRVRKDGTLLSISLTVSPIRAESGEVVGASKIARDISERVRLQAAAREHAATLEKLSQAAVTLASTLDRDTIVRQVINTGVALTRAEAGAFFYMMSGPESGKPDILYALSGVPNEAAAAFERPAASALLAPLLHGDGPIRLSDVLADPGFAPDEPLFGRRDDRSLMRSVLGAPVKGRFGEVLGGLVFGHSRPGTFTDEHERLAIGIAGWAAVALENARLYLEARDANRMKDEFLAVLSHELRTPLNAIVGYARLLRGGILAGDKATRALETLERNASLLTQIVEDVLDVSRIVAGKIRLDVQPVELPLVIDNAAATVQPAADAKGVRVQTIVDPRVGPVSGDPDRLQQVVWNLLSNAVKFTPKGGRVQVRVERVNSHVEIVVSDTGIGIPLDFLPYVFERFRQAEAGTTRKTGGLGLGLAIVRHIVEMHGGTVQASSDGEGAGATFRVRLPLMIIHPQGLDARREHPRSERTAAPVELGDLNGARIVGIDDDADALTLLRVVLEAAGADVTTVSAPRDAIERIEDVKPHVIVVDLGMPDIDGFELIRRIRASPHAHVRDVPAIALTAFARSDDRTRVLRSGFEMHLAKPVDPAELVASIATLVRRTRPSR